MNVSQSYLRPRTLKEVSDAAGSLEAFGRHLRDWQHEIQRSGVHSRPEMFKRIKEAPRKLSAVFEQGDVADSMLAAYAEWIADNAGIQRPDWVSDPERISKNPWFGSPARGWLIANTPASFRQRGLFTIPEPVFSPKRGRPPVPNAQKKRKARERQKAYRQRVRVLLEQARAAE